MASETRVLVIGFIANLLVRPVSERFHVGSEEREDDAPKRRGLATGKPREA